VDKTPSAAGNLPEEGNYPFKALVNCSHEIATSGMRPPRNWWFFIIWLNKRGNSVLRMFDDGSLYEIPGLRPG